MKLSCKLSLVNSHATLVLVWPGHESWWNSHVNSLLSTLMQLLFSFDQDTRVDETLMKLSLVNSHASQLSRNWATLHAWHFHPNFTATNFNTFFQNFIKRDKILYLDTDTLVLSPLEQIWRHFSEFNSTQLAAMAPEGQVPGLNWYHRFARHPFYGTLGLNSGVMLMDLRKLRNIDFAKKIIEIYREYKYNIVWGDQDLLNIFFNKYPGKLKTLLCSMLPSLSIPGFQGNIVSEALENLLCFPQCFPVCPPWETLLRKHLRICYVSSNVSRRKTLSH